MLLDSVRALGSGGSVTEDFRDEIARLAETARDEIRTRDEKAAKRERKRRVHPAIWIGIVLICLELASLGLLTYLQRREIKTYRAQPNRLLTQNDCRGEMYRTYRALVTFRQQTGKMPKDLVELVGKGLLPRAPIDPATKKPLVYSSDGTRFTLHCPDTATGPSSR
jgi:hypothetical protein